MKTVAALLALGCLLGGCKKSAPEEAADAKQVTVVDLVKCTRQSMTASLQLEGSFEASQGTLAKLAPAVQGRVKTIFVTEGQFVRKGQVLVKLDPSIQNAQQESARAALDSASVQVQQSQAAYTASRADQETNLRAAQAGLEQTKAEGRNTLAQAEFLLEQNKSDLAKLRNGARPLELAQAHEVTVQARTAEARAQTELDRDQALWPQGYISKRQLDDASTALETARSVSNAADDSERLLKSGARVEEIRSGESKVAAAAEALRSAQRVVRLQIATAESNLKHAKSGALQVRIKQDDILSSQGLAKQKSADLSAIRASTALLEIRAPFDGKVIKRSMAPGELADTSNPVVLVQKAGSHASFVATGLPEQVSGITQGSEATIQTKSGTYTGRVTSISPPDAAGNLSTVRISVQGSPLSGTFGTAQILLKRLPDALVVPTSCVVQKDGKEVVFKDVDGVAKLTPVTLGPDSDGKTVIVTGLKFGDSVVASGGNELDGDAKIADAAAAEKDKGKDPGP